jgi:hypothetical protein
MDKANLIGSPKGRERAQKQQNLMPGVNSNALLHPAVEILGRVLNCAVVSPQDLPFCLGAK